MPAISPLLLAVALVVYLPPALVLSWIDGREHRLPNRWVAMLTVAVLLALALCALADPALRPTLRSAVLLALVLGAAAVLVALLAPPLLGMGDAKTLPVVVLMSASLGGEVLLASLLGIAVLGGFAGAAVMAATRRAGTRFPVGPVLLAGPYLGLLGAPWVAAALGTT
ncbi:prepilin peptidase [Brachybacterium sp. YJGR34]|uniref:prepilin peptidase n=1 Tax=Brachybacterium sp. YJGR34 TaxID=2059911 RepID=UPI000E0C688F|nr:prepilin peptidase [Brachybacterium sp. YJGR34]